LRVAIYASGSTECRKKLKTLKEVVGGISLEMATWLLEHHPTRSINLVRGVIIHALRSVSGKDGR
jgi:hypothetical protein